MRHVAYIEANALWQHDAEAIEERGPPSVRVSDKPGRKAQATKGHTRQKNIPHARHVGMQVTQLQGFRRRG
jgi:hypothetical protein